jgi:hypothetical protein
MFVEETEGWSLTPDNHEGVHVTCASGFGAGWILLRKSLHDPQMPTNIESDILGGVAQMKASVDEFLAGFDGLRLP